MIHTSTHNYAILRISPAAYDEIRAKLEATGYADQFDKDMDGETIDMHGLALQAEPRTPHSERIDELLAEMPPGRSCERCGGSMIHERLRGYRCAKGCDF